MLTDIRAQYRQKFRQELVRCTDFWLKYGMDGKYGGIYTCLDRTGKYFPRIRAYGCRGGADGCSHGFAIHMA